MMPVAMPKQLACDRHGGTFETSPFRGFGEVSIDPVAVKTAGKQPSLENGMPRAINYIRLGVAANLPSSTGRGGARNRADRVSYALTTAHIANLRAAEGHAAAVGLPFTRMITIHWQAAGVPLESMAQATGRFTDLMTKMLARNGSATTWLWVHENGDGKGWHCHLLAHVPAEHVKRLTALQKGWLRLITGYKYRKGVIHSKPIGGRLGLEVGNTELHFINLEAAFGYCCKGAPQTVLDSFGIDRAHEPGGRVIGKRCATSQNIGAKARKIKG
ncbi:hypothetical protein [uncultured Parasphingorhabdus sp.]|uniref:hypothetical protein n=1 Tax=uncultured Parasphingorhabdus sp. TaxID=2709694 RepID=UPI002AA87DA0|nr:hypothetical protein [uncultured Parasphingorhabdus sp.]